MTFDAFGYGGDLGSDILIFFKKPSTRSIFAHSSICALTALPDLHICHRSSDALDALATAWPGPQNQHAWHHDGA